MDFQDFFDDNDTADFSTADKALFQRWFQDKDSIVTTKQGEALLRDHAFRAASNLNGRTILEAVRANGFAEFALRQFFANKASIIEQFAFIDDARRQELARREAEQAREAAAKVAEQDRQDTLAGSLLDDLAKRAGYAGGDDLQERDGALYSRLVETVNSYKWGRRLLVEDVFPAEEIGARAGAIWKNVVGKKIDEWRGEAVTAVPAALEAAEKGAGDVAAEIVTFLRAHVLESFTYNQIAAQTNVDYKTASRTLRALVSGQDAKIIEFEVVRGEGASAKKVKLFKFAPWRKIIDIDPGRTDQVVKASMLALIRKKPALSVRKIREEMRAAYGHLANDIISRALKTLLAEGAVVTVPGPARANLHYVAGAEKAMISCDF